MTLHSPTRKSQGRRVGKEVSPESSERPESGEPKMNAELDACQSGLAM
jgi:hypothetical protein